MARRRSVEELTTEELRHLLVEKRRAERTRRLDYFRRSGRVVLVEPQPLNSAFEAVGSPLEDDIPTEPSRRSSRRRTFDSLLLVLEAIAVIRLFFVVFNDFSLMRSLI